MNSSQSQKKKEKRKQLIISNHNTIKSLDSNKTECTPQTCCNYEERKYFQLKLNLLKIKIHRKKLPLVSDISISYLERFCLLIWIIIRLFVSRYMQNFLFKSQYILFAYKVAHLYSTITSPEEVIFNRQIQLSQSGHKHSFRAIAIV